jgi:hypothetical protein
MGLCRASTAHSGPLPGLRPSFLVRVPLARKKTIPPGERLLQDPTPFFSVCPPRTGVYVLKLPYLRLFLLFPFPSCAIIPTETAVDGYVNPREAGTRADILPIPFFCISLSESHRLARRVLQKGGVPAAPSGTATLLRLSPSHRSYPRSLPEGLRTSGTPDSHGLTGGVYKARERIHRAVADARLLANPTSRSRVADSDPNCERLSGSAPCRQVAPRCTAHCNTCVAPDIRAVLI